MLLLKALGQHSTCLPVPDDDFQTGKWVEMPCLSDPTNPLDQIKRSPFTESIIFASICRHLAVHRQQSTTDCVQGNAPPQAFWDRHNWLNEVVKMQENPLLLSYPTPLHHSDPILLFTSMIAHAIVLCLCNIMESVHCEAHDYQNAVAAFRPGSLLAARKILDLSRSLAQLSFLKVSSASALLVLWIPDFANLGAPSYPTSSSHMRRIPQRSSLPG